MSTILTHESLAAIPEGKLVRGLLADPHWRERLFRSHGISSDAKHYPEVLLDGVGKEGDIDVLVVDPVQPEYATCVQVKRIKVSAQTFVSGKPNRLSAVAELKRQSNLLVELGFWQVFSYAIVVVDSRANNRGAYSFEGVTSQLRTVIDGGLTTTDLHEKAGLLKFELTQPIDDYPLGAGTFTGRILRMPTVQSQAASITRWVRQVVAERDA